jgi:hypothetical protein
LLSELLGLDGQYGPALPTRPTASARFPRPGRLLLAGALTSPKRKERARAGSWDAKVSSAANGFAVLFKTPRCPFFRAFHENFPYHQTKAARGDVLIEARCFFVDRLKKRIAPNDEINLDEVERIEI